MSRLRGVLHDPLLSLVMPVFNEAATIGELVKIGWRDGVVALWVLLRYRFSE